MRYIGGKALLLDKINNIIDSEIPDISSVIDLFAGSGIVSNNFKSRNYKTFSNDFLFFSYAMLKGTVGLNKKPSFRNIHVKNPIQYLNDICISDTSINIDDCFIYKNYSPNDKCERMYFQPPNALKIDIIRITIQSWYSNGYINENEFFYLLSALINAVPFVSNITGVYASYLKFWDKRTYNPLILTEPQIINNGKKNDSFNLDFTKVISKKRDLLYADPPYNSREYLPNYHILETIAKYDYPKIHGITGMRDYDNQKSVFCKKSTVASAFDTLVRDCQSKYILISYNNEALLSTFELSEICKKYAVDNSFKLFEFNYRRYKNKIPNNNSGLKEQLYLLRRH